MPNAVRLATVVYHAARVTETSDRIGRFRARALAAPMTAFIGAVCLVAFIGTLGVCAAGSAQPVDVAVEAAWSLGSCRETLVRGGALELARVWIDGEWWRVGTTGLLHGSLIHVTLNTWSLFSVGEWAERVWGAAGLLGLFVLSSVGGCLASLAWAEAPMVVGASAGVLGIAGALLGARLAGDAETRNTLAPISVGMLGGCLAVLLLIGFFVPLIAQAGHLGGLGVGAILGVTWGHRGLGVRALGAVAALAVCAALVRAGRSPEGRPGFDELVGYRLLEVGEFERASEALDRALEGRPDDPQLANAVAYSFAEARVALPRARELVLRALDDEPDNADYLDTLGWIECQLGDTEAGLEALDRAAAAASTPILEVTQHRAQCASVAP